MLHSNFDEVREDIINTFFFFFYKTYELENVLYDENVSGFDFLLFIDKVINNSIYLFGNSPYSSKKSSYKDLLEIIESNFNIARALGVENQFDYLYLNWKKIINYENYKKFNFLDTIKIHQNNLLELSSNFYLNGSTDKKVNDYLINIEVYPSRKIYLSTTKSRIQKSATINIYLPISMFDFYDFINIPFYIFHELTSHIVSTTMFADLLENRNDFAYGIFEDGWMLYCEYDYYWNYINKSNENSWLRSQALDFYINRIFDFSNVIYNGFQIARWFHNSILGLNHSSLWSLTCDLALTSFDNLGHKDFHSEFVNKIENINRRGMGEKLKKLMKDYSTPDDFAKSVFNI